MMIRENDKEKAMTTKEVAELLGTKPNVITENAKKCLPNKKIKNGRPTFWNEKEITILLDFMKRNNNRTDLELSNRVIGAATNLTPALMIKQAMELAQKGYELELKRIEQEKKELEERNRQLQIELDESKEWYSVKRVFVETGREYGYRPLKKYSEKNGYEIHKAFDQNYGEVNAYHIDVWYRVYGLEL